jgi:hypothetical protein
MAPDGIHVVEKGTPLVQVIPFRRNGATMKAEIRGETDSEAFERDTIYRNTIAGEGWYRMSARATR